MMNVLKMLLLQNRGSAAVPVTYLYLDKYTTALIAGNVNGTACEPGPGSRAVNVDAETKVNIASGLLKIPTQTAHNYRGLYSGNIARASGIGYVVTCPSANFGNGRIKFGTTELGNEKGEIQGPTLNICGNVALNLAGKNANVRSASGYTTWIQGNKIIYVSHLANTANMGISLVCYFSTEAADFDNTAVVQFGEPFQTDYGLATQRIATNSAGDTITQLADALVTWTFTAQTGVTKELSVRYVDDDNRWVVRLDQANSKIYLYERNAGVETERGATGGVALTQTNGTAYRVMVIMDTQTIFVCAAAASGESTLKITYTSASFNQTATTAKASHAGTNLISYPRNLTGAALSEYQRVYPF